MNRSEVILFIAATMDGYIATADHNLDWLMAVEGEGDNGISAFYDTVDAILMGRNTYEWILQHTEDFPYQDKDCYVVSSTRTGEDGRVSFIKGAPDELLQQLSKKGGRRIWLMGGSRLIASFFNQRLVDEVVLTIAPVLLGHGIPLAEGLLQPRHLRLQSLQRYGQFVSLHYTC